MKSDVVAAHKSMNDEDEHECINERL